MNTTTYVRTIVNRTHDFPRHVIIRKMDQARQREESARRDHDEFALELGVERVYIEDVKPGDVIESNRTSAAYEVKDVNRVVDRSGIGEWWVVQFTDANGSCDYDAGQLVSRVLPDIEEAF